MLQSIPVSSFSAKPAISEAALVILPGLIWGGSFVFIAEGLEARREAFGMGLEVVQQSSGGI
ncbi:MAG: hypothetical protein ABR606_03060 [Vicinamibacterales bacterium]